MADAPATQTVVGAAAAQSASQAAEGVHETFLGALMSNPPHAWIVAGTTLVVLVVVVQVLRRVVLTRIERLASKTATKWDDVLVEVLKKVRLWLIFPALVLAAAQSVHLPEILDKTLRLLAVGGLVVQLLIMASKVVDAGLTAMAGRARRENGEPDATVASSLGVARVLAMGLIGGVLLLLALDNLGVKITPMLTGLGIGGIAVALAVQNILGDLFGSLTIILDKPFVVGDFIAVGQQMGTVEHIGVKTTRVRALSGEQLIFSNSDLLSSRVQNFKRMQERRVVFSVGITYETPVETVRGVPGIIRAAIERQSPVRVDRCHFKGFGAYSLDFETVYFVKSSEFNVYMDIQQAVNLELMEQFAVKDIQFAYPTAVAINRLEPDQTGAALSHMVPAGAADLARDAAGVRHSGGEAGAGAGDRQGGDGGAGRAAV